VFASTELNLDSQALPKQKSPVRALISGGMFWSSYSRAYYFPCLYPASGNEVARQSALYRSMVRQELRPQPVRLHSCNLAQHQSLNRRNRQKPPRHRPICV
jgi:hypothetical protein